MRTAILLFAIITHALSADLHGVIAQSQRLKDTSEPYAVLGRVSVGEGVTLAVGPSVRIDGMQNGFMHIRGRVILGGQKAKPVVLDGGAWKGHVYARHCSVAKATIEIDHQKASGHSTGFEWSVFVDSRVRGGHYAACTFTGGTMDTAQSFAGCVFKNVAVQSPYALMACSRCVFTNCTFGSNSSQHLPDDVAITTCSFDDASWASLQAALGKMTFPRGELLIRNAALPRRD